MLFSDSQKILYRNSHAVNMPLMQPHHCLPHADLNSYFEFIYPSTPYRGMVTIAAHKDGAMKLVGVVPVEMLADWTSHMHISTKMDYFYARGQHCGGKSTWGGNGAFAHNAIYVDVDAHANTHTSADDQQVVDLLVNTLPERGIPCPNIVEFSGRGIHLVWGIEQVSYKLGYIVAAVSTHYATITQAILSDHAVIDYSADIAYSANVNGLTRLPGSFNTSAGCCATYQMLHTNRLDLSKAYDSVPHTKASIRRFGVAASIRRFDALVSLASIRDIEPGIRDLYCLHLYCAALWAGISKDAALEAVIKINNSFSSPLSEAEVRRLVSTAARKEKPYKFTNARILDDLQISAEEQNVIGLRRCSKRNSNRARAAKNAAKKRNRDRRIMRLHLLGYSQAAIVKKLRHDRKTIKSVLSKYKENLTILFSAYELNRIKKVVIQRAIAVLKKVSSYRGGKNRSPIYCAYKAAYQCSPTVGDVTVSHARLSPQERDGYAKRPPPGTGHVSSRT